MLYAAEKCGTPLGIPHFLHSTIGYCVLDPLMRRFDVQVGFMQDNAGWYSDCLPESFIQYLQELRIGEAVINRPTPHIVKSPYASASETKQLLEKIAWECP